jgi:hypothetical protein
VGSFYQADRPVRLHWNTFCIRAQGGCELAELLAYKVLSGIVGDIVRGSYVGVDPAITECLPGMLCAEVTQLFHSLVAGGLIYYVEYRVSVNVHHVDIDRVVEDRVLVCS